MQIEKYEAEKEKRVLTSMIMEQHVLSRVSVKWEPQGLFRSRWANIVGAWAVDWYRKYQTAPKASIEDMFQDWAEKNKDDTTVTLVDNFLADLSDEYEAESDCGSLEYMVDIAGQLFKEVSMERHLAAVGSTLSRGSVDMAEEMMCKWNTIEFGVGAGINLFQDKEAVRRAFEVSIDPLIQFDGDLGRFMGNQFGRDEFVSVIGATGRGKTWWLLEIAWRAMRQRRRVAFFEVGDMSEAQITKRFAVRASGIPIFPKMVNVPTSIRIDDKKPFLTFEKRVFEYGLDEEVAIAAFEQATRRHKKNLFKLSVHPNSSINVAGISSILDGWEMDGWIPDVVVIDYADLLAVPAGCRQGERDSINETWKQLRGLSQKRHILVLTATQGDAKSYEAETIRRGNFSDDRRKLDHVTGMLGINVSDPEKEMGITRLNWIKRREAEYNESQCCYVAGCLEIGRPCMCSVF